MMHVGHKKTTLYAKAIKVAFSYFNFPLLKTAHLTFYLIYSKLAVNSLSQAILYKDKYYSPKSLQSFIS